MSSNSNPLPISGFEEGNSVELPLMILQKEVRQSKTGSSYLHMVLRDASGSITAFMWDNFEGVVDSLQPGTVVRVKGRVQKYRNNLQLVIHRAESVQDDSVPKQDFMPSSEIDPEQMVEEVRNLVLSMEDGSVRALIEAFLSDSAIMDAMKQAPAAKTMHHSYIGGLLEHTLSLMHLADAVCIHYDNLNRDLMLAGAFFHDIGKIRELSHDGWLDYSREGRLIGHITLGTMMVDEKIQSIEGFPEETREHILHMLLAHHGEYEFGSPRRPKTREALTLHFLDNLDSHLNGFDLALKDQSGDVAYSRILNRFIYDS